MKLRMFVPGRYFPKYSAVHLCVAALNGVWSLRLVYFQGFPCPEQPQGRHSTALVPVAQFYV